MTNEELGGKFKAILKEYHHSLDVNAVGEYLRELDCQFFMHEFVKKAIVYALETVSFEIFNSLFRVRIQSKKLF